MSYQSNDLPDPGNDEDECENHNGQLLRFTMCLRWLEKEGVEVVVSMRREDEG